MDNFSELNNVGYTFLMFFIIANVLLFGWIISPLFKANANNYQQRKFILQLIYHLFVFAILIAVSFSVSDTKCGEYTSFDSINAIKSAIISYIFIFVSGAAFLYIFPGWIRGFSNTFGMSALHLSNFKDFIQKKIFIQEPNKDSNSFYRNIYNDPLPLFNELIPEFFIDEKSGRFQWNSYKELYDKLIKQDIYLQSPEKDHDSVLKLADQIAKKEFIGYTIWYMALGCIAILFTVIQSLDTKCMRDPTQSSEFKAYTTKKFDEV